MPVSETGFYVSERTI